MLAVLWVGLYTHNHIYWNCNYNKLGGYLSKTRKIIGGIIAALITGVAWWYIIDLGIKLNAL